MAAQRKPTIPEVLPDFLAYYRQHPAWGALHIVLDDGNVLDRDVEFCIKYAAENGDAEGERLARILLKMSVTQRAKLDAKVDAAYYGRTA